MIPMIGEHLPLLCTVPDGIQKLRGLILDLAVRGKLVSQDSNEEPASELLQRIAQAQKQNHGLTIRRKSKPKMLKETGEWPFAIPSGWAWSRVGELAEILRGVSYEKSQASEKALTGYLPLLRGNNINQKLNFDKLVFVDRTIVAKEQEIRQGDIVIAMSSGSAHLVGKAAQADTDLEYGFGAFCGVIRAFSAELHPYFGLFFQTPLYRNRVAALGKGIGINNLQKSSLQLLECPIPPLAEQHRIVAKVNELMAICDRLEADQTDAEAAHLIIVSTLLDTLLESSDADELTLNWQRLADHFATVFSTESSLDALKQAIIDLGVRGLLTGTSAEGGEASCTPSVEAEEKPYSIDSKWKWYRMEEIVTFQGGSQPPKTTFVYQPQEGYTRLVQIRDFKSNAYLTYIPNERANRLFNEDDVMIGRYGPPVFQILRGLSGTYNVALMKASPLTLEISKNFLFWLLQESRIHDTVVRESERTAGQTGIRLPLLYSFVVGVPPKAEQQRIVAKIEELMSLCDLLKAQLTESWRREEQLASVLIDSALRAA